MFTSEGIEESKLRSPLGFTVRLHGRQCGRLESGLDS